MKQPAVSITAIHPRPFDRLVELLDAARQYAQLTEEDRLVLEDRLARYPAGRAPFYVRAPWELEDVERQVEAKHLLPQAWALAADLGLPRDEVKRVLGHTLGAMHRLYLRGPKAEDAYKAAAGPLAAMAAEVRRRARPANVAAPPAAPASASGKKPATPPADDGPYLLAEELQGRWSKHFRNLKSFTDAVRDNPRVRHRRPLSKTGKPILNRLELHVQDVLKFLADLPRLPRKGLDDLLAGKVDELLDVQAQRRQEQERADQQRLRKKRDA
jgi:hypothetical protein